jgi:radical SAM-linked protein
VDIAYSNGYNPHPRINLAQPLSLGFESESEYLEIETETPSEVDKILLHGNQALPQGMILTAGKEAQSGTKNLSSVVDYAEYLILLPEGSSSITQELVDHFTSQKTIIVSKRDKKTKKFIEKDVKSMIFRLEPVNDAIIGVGIRAVLRSASNEALNPLQLMESLCSTATIPFEKEACRVIRKELYCLLDHVLVSLFDCCNLGKGISDEKEA